jgi:hypothetical protein
MLRLVVHIVAPIALGSIIYILFRGVYIIDPTAMYFPLLSTNTPYWFLYNLPDGLWLYSLLSALAVIWQGYSSRQFHTWFLFALFASYLTEVLQASQLIPGRFDWMDIIAYSVAALAHFCISYSFRFDNCNASI